MAILHSSQYCITITSSGNILYDHIKWQVAVYCYMTILKQHYHSLRKCTIQSISFIRCYLNLPLTLMGLRHKHKYQLPNVRTERCALYIFNRCGCKSLIKHYIISIVSIHWIYWVFYPLDITKIMCVKYGNKSVKMSDTDMLCALLENCMSGKIGVSRLSL